MWIKIERDNGFDKFINLNYKKKYIKKKKYEIGTSDIKFKNLNQIFGFMRTYIRNDQYEFYYSEKNDPHTQVAQNRVRKKLLVKTFNRIKKKYKYNSNTDITLIKDNKKIKLTVINLFIEMELTLRYYNYIKKDDKTWFLNPYDDYLLKTELGIKY